MSRPPLLPVQRLVDLLDLEVVDRDLFRSCHVEAGGNPVSLYGGRVAAESLRAAGATVDAERVPHSLHGYFLRRGRPDLPVIYQVDRDRDGGSFSARGVRAIQDGEVIFSMVASFQTPEEGVAYDALDVPEVPTPDAVPARAASPALAEVHEVHPTYLDEVQVHHSDYMWVRCRGELPDDPLLHACGVAYVSDFGSGFGQVDIPDLPVGGPSIDHSIWFHDAIRADEWMLLRLWPIKASNARGVYSGSVRSLDGRLGAVLAQEMLLRPFVLEPDTIRAIAAHLGLEVPERLREEPDGAP